MDALCESMNKVEIEDVEHFYEYVEYDSYDSHFDQLELSDSDSIDLNSSFYIVNSTKQKENNYFAVMDDSSKTSTARPKISFEFTPKKKSLQTLQTVKDTKIKIETKSEELQARLPVSVVELKPKYKAPATSTNYITNETFNYEGMLPVSNLQQNDAITGPNLSSHLRSLHATYPCEYRYSGIHQDTNNITYTSAPPSLASHEDGTSSSYHHSYPKSYYNNTSGYYEAENLQNSSASVYGQDKQQTSRESSLRDIAHPSTNHSIYGHFSADPQNASAPVYSPDNQQASEESSARNNSHLSTPHSTYGRYSSDPQNSSASGYSQDRQHVSRERSLGENAHASTPHSYGRYSLDNAGHTPHYKRSERKYVRFNDDSDSSIPMKRVKVSPRVQQNVCQPVYKDHQLMGDSQLLRFAEKLLRVRKKLVSFSEVTQSRRLGYCISGQKISDLYTLLQAEGEELKIHTNVILLIGTNDIIQRTPVPVMCENYKNIIEILKEKTNRLVLLTTPPIPKFDNDHSHWLVLQQLNKFILSHREEGKVFVIDLASLYVSYNNTSSMTYYEEFYYDGQRVDKIHLNVDGFKLLRSILQIEYFDKE